MKNGPATLDGSQSASGRRFTPRVVPNSPGPAPDESCDVHLNLPARAENVVLVRHVVGALAEAMRFPAMHVEDIRLAVTEACTNVVRHAYGNGGGPLQVAASTGPGGLEVVVTDEGDGIQPRPMQSAGGLGIPLMAAVAAEFEIDRSRSRGTRVRMTFIAGQ